MREKTSGLMRTIFGLDNGVMRTAERVFDLILLNLLFVLCSFPLVTQGLAKIALYRSLVDLRERGRLPLVVTYLGHLKANWRQGLIIGLGEGVVTLLCLVNLYLVQGQSSLLVQGLQVLAYAMLFLNLVVHLYLYPLVGRASASLRGLYTRAVMLAGLNAGWSLVLVMAVLAISLLVGLPSLGLMVVLSLFLILGFAGLAYLYMLVMEGIMARYQ